MNPDSQSGNPQITTNIENALILTMIDGRAAAPGSLRIEGKIITHVGTIPADLPAADVVIDARGGVLIPGFVQPHIHLCQTLFRNLADDLTLLDWLRLRIWPMEAALTEADMRTSSDLGLAELIRSGTTTVLDMGSVEHTDQVGEAVESAGSRAFIGKAMMDRGVGVPDGLREDTRRSLRESEALCKRWHGRADGRIQYAYAPRFAPSCTTELLRSVGDICHAQNLVIHTHCAENADEIELVKKEFGMKNLLFLDDCNLTGPRSVFAHMIHLDDEEVDLVAATQTSITHCPCSNCKLASGVAPIPHYLAKGIKVGLGADGAPCNNNLDAFVEMRLAALIHKPRFGSTSMDAQTVLRMATLGGAEVLGIQDQIGTLEVGKRADLLHLRLDRPFNGVAGSPYSKIVYSGSRENVVDVFCDGVRLLADGVLRTLDEGEVYARGREAVNGLLTRL